MHKILPATLVLCLTMVVFVGLGSVFAKGLAQYNTIPLQSLFGRKVFSELQTHSKNITAKSSATKVGTTGQHYLNIGQHDTDLIVPDFSLPTLDGKIFNMKSMRGKKVVLNFWSITCPPCLKELPSLEQLAHSATQWHGMLTETPNEPQVVVVAISADSKWSDVRKVAPKNTRIIHLLDKDQQVIKGLFGANKYPETWVIDAHGVIRLRYDGALDWSSPVAIDAIRSL